MKIRQTLTSLFFLVLFSGFGQQTQNVQDSLVSWIASQQVESDTFYNDGLFKSRRFYGKNVYDDNTLFYSSLIALTLHSISEQMPPRNRELVDSIYMGVKNNAFRYQSRRGRPAFNYWQTDPDIPHPNGPAKYQTDKYKIPDDFDDTSMIGLLLDSPEFSLKIRNEMTRYTAERRKKVRTTFKRLKTSEAYGVWFADKWNQEFDICVLANTLSFVFQNNYELNPYDSASIEFIKRSINDDLHKKHPYVLSPYYNKTPVILYHISRLMSQDPAGHLSSLKSKIVSDIKEELEEVDLEMHRAILYTSLFRLEEKPVPQVDIKKLRAEADEFNWFESNIMVAMGTRLWLRKLFNNSKIVPTFYWRCKAYYWTLYLEYLVLSNPA